MIGEPCASRHRHLGVALLAATSLCIVANSTEAAPKSRRAAPKPAPTVVVPVDPYSADRAQIAAWRDRLISSSFMPERSVAILADGTMPRLGQKTCTDQTPPATVAMEIRPKAGRGRPGEDHRMIGYRGDSGAWCMATGVGVITFDDGSRWLGQVSTSGAAGGSRNFLPRPDGLGEMIAQDGTRRPQKVAARSDILWGFDVLETLPVLPGSMPTAVSSPATVRTAAAGPVPVPQKVAVAAPVPKETTPPNSRPPPQGAGLTGNLFGSLVALSSAQAGGTGSRPVAMGAVGQMKPPAAPTAPSSAVTKLASLPKPPPVTAARAVPARPGQAFDIIEGTSGLYMSPFTSDGVTSAWITKSMQVKAASQVGAMAGNYLGQKAMEQVPFVGGFLGKKAGEAMGRQVALSAIGGEAFLRSSTDLSFNNPEALVGWTLANYGSRQDIAQIMQAVITIYPEVQAPYVVAAGAGKKGLVSPRPVFLQDPR